MSGHGWPCGHSQQARTSTLTGTGVQVLNNDGVATAVLPMDGFHYYRTDLDAMSDPQVPCFRRRGASQRGSATFRQLHTLHRRLSELPFSCDNGA